MSIVNVGYKGNNHLLNWDDEDELSLPRPSWGHYLSLPPPTQQLQQDSGPMNALATTHVGHPINHVDDSLLFLLDQFVLFIDCSYNKDLVSTIFSPATTIVRCLWVSDQGGQWHLSPLWGTRQWGLHCQNGTVRGFEPGTFWWRL